MTENGDMFSVEKNDALIFLKNIESESVGAVVADPPYCTHPQYAATGHYECGDGIIGDNKDAHTNYMFMRRWMSECFRILKPGCRLFVFCDKFNIFLTQSAGVESCFKYGGFITWCKTNSRPAKMRFSKTCEYALEFYKGDFKIASDKYPKDYHVEGAPTGKERVHQTQKPVELIRKLLTFTPENGLVVDPFCGSGSTGVAALELGFRFMGADLSEKCVEVSTRRCREAAEKFEEKIKDNTVSSSHMV